MATVTEKRIYTPEDLLTMPDGDRFELVNGCLVEKNIGAWSSYIAGRVFAHLEEFCRVHGGGWLIPDAAGYQCFSQHPGKVRKPDVSFIRLARLPEEQQPGGHIAIAPDLAVEVISPNDLAYEIDEKVEDYLDAGVPLVWVVNPETHTIRVHRGDKPGMTLRPEDELTGEEVLPGFHIRVADLFQPPVGPADIRN